MPLPPPSGFFEKALLSEIQWEPNFNNENSQLYEKGIKK
jgi:hypothetical protein